MHHRHEHARGVIRVKLSVVAVHEIPVRFLDTHVAHSLDTFMYLT